jgi:4-amino-4-deoxy-L-arabinose transferase-like glycosyltransferase
MQIIVSVAAIIISTTVGYLYVGELMVDGWQLWTWLLTVVVLTMALLANSLPRKITLTDWKILLVLVVLALLLRATFLETIPGNLHVDEMGTADFPMRHLFTEQGTSINPFRTGASWQPSLYHYITRLSFLIFGYSVTGIRMTSAVAGVAAVIAMYIVVRVFDNRRTALMAAAIMTTYHYHIQWSRIALNNIWDTLWVPLALAAFAWGWRKGWSGGAVISGLAVGISHYFYAGSQIVVFLMMVLMIQLYRQEQDEQKALVHGGKFLATAVTVAAPIILFAIIDSETFFGRAQTIVGWTPEAVEHVVGSYNLWRYFWFQLWHNVGAYTSVAEVTGFYGPGIPFLFGIAAPLFIIGFLWSLYKRHYIPVLWIVFTTFFGGFLLSGSPSSSHYAVAIPAICWLTAVPLNWLWQRGYPRLAFVLLIAIMITDVSFYYGIYIPSHPRDFIHPLPTLPN